MKKARAGALACQAFVNNMTLGTNNAGIIIGIVIDWLVSKISYNLNEL
jgi:hypothetical protein